MDHCMSEVLFEMRGDHVALITINRPEVRNAINGAVARALEHYVASTEADLAIRCVVLTGAGERAFCAGADLKAISAGRIRELVTREGGFAGFVRARRTKPWIVAAEGPALAGGTEILLACDMAVISQNTTLGLPEVKRGLAALAGGLYRLPRCLPRAIALELIATGDPITADRALAHGLVNAVVPQGQVVDAALQLAGRIAENAPVAVRESLALARRAFDLSESELEEESDALAVRLAKTRDYLEGPRAFIEKRAPAWLGY